ncbi:sugar phosphate isomerase/epimerase [Thermosporothrix hazakensis]|uniref:Sugar phosphate isomerase/epimerase n=3 Tax=Thermosporothrix TaxID=768650 RepID=A0A326U1M4_THEHA|nr:sugar phosphate isomerase/epimerase [Thermosporothrix hazakensis]BBH88287.1 hypothetical protein KTC_30380 [Thermosporothrix sp. COM3]GCE46474.1 hypothetical protein KTH_13430 [Thermosporothrix hazakensis]
MNPRISFMGANYVARAVGYHMVKGWGEGDEATNRLFQPLETFAERFEQIVSDIHALGFTTMDVWLAHLHWSWATEEHIRLAREILRKYSMRVASLAGFFGSTREELASSCRLARALETTVLGGTSSLLKTDRASTIAILKEHGVVLGIENHPEKTPQEVLAQIGDDGEGALGTALDTGWFATQGYDAVRAIEELFPTIVHMHLKDVLQAGEHETCRFGRGIVDVEQCVRTLRRLGYSGYYSIEHEPELYDPTEDCRVMLTQVSGWLAE